MFALLEILKLLNKQADPLIVECFNSVWKEITLTVAAGGEAHIIHVIIIVGETGWKENTEKNN